MSLAIQRLSEPSVRARFWSKVDVRAADECWPWTDKPRVDGYGQFSLSPTVLLAHRVAFEINHGPIPANKQVDHRCRNRWCVNPGHLQAVSHKENGENLGGANRGSQSGVRGVFWHKAAGRWCAIVGHNGVRHVAGYFKSIDKAEVAVIELRNKLFSNNLADRAPIHA